MLAWYYLVPVLSCAKAATAAAADGCLVASKRRKRPLDRLEAFTTSGSYSDLAANPMP